MTPKELRRRIAEIEDKAQRLLRSDEELTLLDLIRDLQMDALSSPACACIDAEDVENWIAGMSTLDDAGDRTKEANAIIKGLRDRTPCPCRGREPLAVVKGYINKDDPFHLQEDLKLTPHVPHQLHISGLRGNRGIAYHTLVPMDTLVRVIILEEKS